MTILDDITKDDITKLFFDFLEQRKEIDKNKLKYILNKEILIPTNIFKKDLGCLESIIKFLKENKNMTNKEICTILNRAPSTISLSYTNAQKKHPQKFSTSETNETTTLIPLNEINMKGSVLGNIIHYLKKEKFSLKQICKLLNRDYNTIWLTQKKQEVRA